MQSHLRLHFETEEASDEAVLQAYPATIRCAWIIQYEPFICHKRFQVLHRTTEANQLLAGCHMLCLRLKFYAISINNDTFSVNNVQSH